MKNIAIVCLLFLSLKICNASNPNPVNPEEKREHPVVYTVTTLRLLQTRIGQDSLAQDLLDRVALLGCVANNKPGNSAGSSTDS